MVGLVLGTIGKPLLKSRFGCVGYSLIIWVFTSGLVTGSQPSCPPDYEKLCDDCWGCYRFIQQADHQHEAQLRCEQDNATLAEFENCYYNSMAAHVFNQKRLTKDFMEGEWVWIGLVQMARELIIIH